jgi:hypothetical protein
MVSPAALSRRAATSSLIAGVTVGVLLATRRSGGPTGAGSTTGAASGPSSGATGVAGTSSDHPAPAPTPEPPALPRGGRVLFPAHRLVGYSGGPGSAAFGRLGVGNLDQRVLEIDKLARGYAAGREPLPVLELIAVVVQPWPGRDGTYRVRIPPDVIDTYLAAARRHRALLLLNIQPGRARFLDEVAALERWLVEPDVGVALDPEWAVRPGQVPGRTFGRTTGAEIDAVAGYLAGLVSAHDLPEKALVVHQLRPDIVRGFAALRAHDGVAVVRSVDGIGPPAAKLSTWTGILTDRVSGLHPGFKLFFSEDAAHGSRLMTPAEVLALRPTPEYVLYE